jgi:hypothetical protein
MRRVLAIALMAFGITSAVCAPTPATAVPLSGDTAQLADRAEPMLTLAGGSACWWDVPVVGAGVAFFELLRDEEVDRHCSRYPYEGEIVGEPAPVLEDNGSYKDHGPKHREKYLPPK